MEIMLQNGNFPLTKCTYIAGIQKSKAKYCVTGKFPELEEKTI
jgi:hypothetical protein